MVTADYTDGVRGEVLAHGHGGYTVSGYDPTADGAQTVIVSYSVVRVTKTTSFRVEVAGW
ncbi:hypothetical protein [Micromonospora sp. NPDC005171]|uniref:hypothetical protein n=1 Tax=Micromonospora sp. NPDC005171 TaxID=3156866 RepID=UPI00339F4C90